MKYLTSFNLFESNDKEYSRHANEKTIVKEEKDIKWLKPNFEWEYSEIQRYKKHQKKEKRFNLTMKEWIRIGEAGKIQRLSDLGTIDKIENATPPKYFSTLDPDKRSRFEHALENKEIELPIVAKLSNGKLELIAGNTRLTGLLREGYDPWIWLVEIMKD